MHVDRPSTRSSTRPPPGANDTSSHNLFFALLPDATTREKMYAVVQALQTQWPSGARWLKPHRYHLTLHFLGNFRPLPEEVIAAARHAGAQVRAVEFSLELDQAGSFARNRVGWLGCAQLDPALQQLWEQLLRELQNVQVQVDAPARFKPHVTILRDAPAALPTVPIAPIAWPAREFALIDSRLGGASEYRVLERWPLSTR